ncbi:hypothetical protein BKA82DRAFT_4110200 [Pisolithus tinctorius]|nr:hypothetical protein BKA82DRAFT_4110200 [Pisolithus tinctorius]
MNDAGYRRWSNTEWWERSYERIWTRSFPPDSTSTETETTADADELRTSVVYFTADSENEILELKEGETYVIGGICDHNRYKVLTVNQVVEILLKWVETRDWEEAFWAVIPKRKFQGVERVSPKDDESTTNEVRDGSEPSGHAKKESSAGLEGHSGAPVGEGGGDIVSDSGGEG